MYSPVEKRTLYFGGIVNGSPFASGIPGPSSHGAYLVATGDAPADANFRGVNPRYDEVAVRLDLPSKASASGPVHAISIAPDSAIAEATIWIAGNNGEIAARRVSPGNPLVGVFDDADFALVTIPNAVPEVTISETVIGFDAAAIPYGGVGDSTSFSSWPLRLELWRGSPVQIRGTKRSAYHGAVLCYGLSSGSRTAYFCVDGRNRFEVIVRPIGDLTTIRVEIFAAYPAPNSASRLRDLVMPIPYDMTGRGETGETATPASPVRFVGGDDGQRRGSTTLGLIPALASARSQSFMPVLVGVTLSTGDSDTSPAVIRLSAYD